MNSISSFFIKSLLGLGILSATVLSPKTATAETKTAQAGNIRVEIYYEQPEDYQFKNIRLKIVRAGKTILNQQLATESEYDRPVVALAAENTLPIVDLDGDQEPEVIADFFTGGAHCCTYSLIYRYEQTKNRYTWVRHDWAHTGYNLKDLDKDNLPEFNSADNSFAYAFASFAASGFPVQIWQYKQGKMIDVTRRYPQQIYSNAFRNWQYYLEAENKGYDVKGLLAAYLADKYLLGQGEDGWRRLQQVYREDDRAQYFSQLRNFLQERGYIR